MRREIFGILTAVVLAIVAFVLIETFSSSFRSCIEKDQRTATSYFRCTVRFAEEHDKAISALSAILLAIVTGGLVFVGYLQINTSRAQLRAYVFVESAVTANVVDGTGPPEAHVVIKNFGQTPAYEVLHMGGLAVDEFPPPPRVKLTFTDEDFEDLVIGPTTEMPLAPGANYLSTTPLKVPLPPDLRKAIIAGDRAVYVYGEVRYKDVFRRKQWTKYRLMQGGPVEVRGGHLMSSAEGNEAT